MPNNVSEFIGLREANAALRALPADVKIRVQEVSDVTAFHVSREASAAAPRSKDGSHGNPPGFLSASISWESRPRSLSSVVGVRTAAFYWKFLEYGTRFMAARPFLRPAADRNRVDHQTRLITALEKAAAQVARATNG